MPNTALQMVASPASRLNIGNSTTTSISDEFGIQFDAEEGNGFHHIVHLIVSSKSLL